MPSLRARVVSATSTLVLHVVLPTLDVYSDLLLLLTHLPPGLDVVEEVGGGGTCSLGLLLLPPFLLHHLLAWLAWWRVDEARRCTWVFPALSCYPQYRAIRLLAPLWRGQEVAEERRVVEGELGELEAVVEAAPTVYIMAFALAITGGAGVVTGHTDGRPLDPLTLEVILFLATFLTSVASATMGLVRSLAWGPCRLLPPSSTLAFLLLFLSVGATFVGRGCGLVWLTAFPPSMGVAGRTLMLLTYTLLPPCVLATTSILHCPGWWRSISSHPSLLLLPVFTHFTFTCRGQGQVTFSPRMTLANILVSVAGYAALALHLTLLTEAQEGEDTPHLLTSFADRLLLLLSPAVLGVLLTTLFLALTSCSCLPTLATVYRPEVEVEVLEMEEKVEGKVEGELEG